MEINRIFFFVLKYIGFHDFPLIKLITLVVVFKTMLA
jgi:hypothetical protein